MPYKYFGRKTDFKGKTLWEILGNLKNFGVGRIVCRGMFERYPEPTYMKVVKVETLPEPAVKSPDDVRKVRVWVEKTFRGRKFPKLVTIESASYKTDYKLIPRDEEQSYCKFEGDVADKKILPKVMEYPPLMKQFLLREMKLRGEPVSDIKLEIAYNKKLPYERAEGDKKPTVEFTAGLGTPAAPRLYKDVDL